MGNCQAIDNASLVIQHPNGKADKLYCPIAASEIMKMNPGHYVALLLTTTLYSSPAAASADAVAAATASKDGATAKSNTPLRVTRIKLLRPTDTLVLGHVYRLVTSQEVMKGLWAKKQAKMMQQQPGYGENRRKMTEKKSLDFEAVVRRTDVKKCTTDQVKQERHKSRNNTQVNSGSSKFRAWQPALNSISEATGS